MGKRVFLKNVFQAKQVFQTFQLIDGSELSEGISSLANHFSWFFLELLLLFFFFFILCYLSRIMAKGLARRNFQQMAYCKDIVKRTVSITMIVGGFRTVRFEALQAYFQGH
jgi:hypothetical protein